MVYITCMVYITYSYILYILYHLDLFYLEKKQLCSHAPSYSMVYTTVFTVRLNDYPLSLFPSLFTSNWFSKLQCLDHCTAKDLAVDFSLSLSLLVFYWHCSSRQMCPTVWVYLTVAFISLFTWFQRVRNWKPTSKEGKMGLQGRRGMAT